MTAIAESLAGIEGLQQSPYILPNPTPPTAELIPGQITRDDSFGRSERSTDSWGATVRVTVGAISDIGGQKRLRAFRSPGPDSVADAIEADPTLGGLVDSVRVATISPARQFRRPDGTSVMGCDFELEIWGQGGEHV